MYEGKARVLISTPDWLAGFVGGGWCMVSWCRSTSFGPIYSDDKLGQVKNICGSGYILKIMRACLEIFIYFFDVFSLNMFLFVEEFFHLYSIIDLALTFPRTGL